MTPTELIEMKHTLGFKHGLNRPLNNQEIAKLLDVTRLTINRYITGKRPIPLVVDYAIKYFLLKGMPSDVYISKMGKPRKGDKL